MDIIAHSYGAAVALRLLADAPHSVRSMVLIESAAFFLLPFFFPISVQASRPTAARSQPSGNASASGATWRTGGRCIADVNYWNGRNAFSAMPDDTQRRLASRIRKVVADFDSVRSERMRLASLGKLGFRRSSSWGIAVRSLLG